MNSIRLYSFFILFSVSLLSHGQMTYNHDPVVMNQFMKAEIGSGTLGAGYFYAEQVYYGQLHKGYRNMANNPANNKLASRTLTYAEVLKQENYALQIKDSLEKRAEIELLNMADRQLDVEWLVEKEKIERQQAIFKKSIQDIVYYGGTSSDKTNWTTIYLLLYKDLCTYNTTLNECKAKWWAARSVRNNEGVSQKFTKNRSMISDCYGRWKLAWAGKKGNAGGVPGSGAIGTEFLAIKGWEGKYNYYLKKTQGYAEGLKGAVTLYAEGVTTLRHLYEITKAIKNNPQGVMATVSMNNLYAETAAELIKVYNVLKYTIAVGGKTNMLTGAERTELLWEINDSMQDFNRKLRQLALSIAYYNMTDVWNRATTGLIERNHGEIARQAYGRWVRAQTAYKNLQ